MRRAATYGKAWGVAVAASLLGHLVLVAGVCLLAGGDPAGASRRPLASAGMTWNLSSPASVPAPDLASVGGSEEQESPTDVEVPFSTDVSVPNGAPQPGTTISTSDGGFGGSAFGPDGAGSGGVAPGSAAFFGVPVRQQSVVLLIDRSGSMGFSGGLAAAKREAAALLSRLPESARFQVIIYNRDAVCLCGSRTLHSATPSNVRPTLQALEAVSPAGGTDHVGALRAALDLSPEVIFMVTDAADLTPVQVAVLTRLNGGRAVIHTLAWGRPTAPGDPLRMLAAQNGGAHHDLGGE